MLCALGLVAALTPRADSQALRIVADSEKCAGERVASIVQKPVVRALIPIRGEAGRALTEALRTFETATDTAVIRRYLLISVGDLCAERDRAESEAILRAQPFLSDAAVRAIAVGPGEIRLEVETIDEFQLRVDAWGTTGLPAGAEVGTRNLRGKGASLYGLLEYGYGGHVGGSIKYADYQAFGQRLTLDLLVAQRPLGRGLQFNLRRPFYTSRQRTGWLVGASDLARYTTFRSPQVKDLSMEASHRRWQVARTERRGSHERGYYFGGAITSEEFTPLRTVVIRSQGPVLAPGPLLLDRYRAFSVIRAGGSIGAAKLHYEVGQGIDLLTGSQDVATGAQAFLMVLHGISPSTPCENDDIASLMLWAAGGTPRSMVEFSLSGETRFPHGDLDRRPGSLAGAGLTWFAKSGDFHTMFLGVDGAGGWRPRVPLQLTLRGDQSGVIGWRTSEDGGSQRIAFRAEDRWLLPLGLSSLDVGVSLIAQTGRLWAGDAAYGTTTPWRTGVGVALQIALPAGSKQVLRFEYGRATGFASGREGEIRLFYGSNGRIRSGAIDVWGARETAYVAQ